VRKNGGQIGREHAEGKTSNLPAHNLRQRCLIASEKELMEALMKQKGGMTGSCNRASFV
jgi:hypothetical protein